MNTEKYPIYSAVLSRYKLNLPEHRVNDIVIHDYVSWGGCCKPTNHLSKYPQPHFFVVMDTGMRKDENQQEVHWVKLYSPSTGDYVIAEGWDMDYLFPPMVWFELGVIPNLQAKLDALDKALEREKYLRDILVDQGKGPNVDVLTRMVAEKLQSEKALAARVAI